MTLRSKLLLAQAPLIVSLIVIGFVGRFLLVDLGTSSQRILEDNFRSVLAVQRMAEAIRRMDARAVRDAVGRAEPGNAPGADESVFAAALEAQEGNITEPREAAATGELRRAWEDYSRAYADVHAAPSRDEAQALYFDRLVPAFLRIRSAMEGILAMNQDAMVRKSEAAKRTAERSITLLVIVSLAGLVLALWASAAITSRLLHPLSVLRQAARRIGEGDLAARARVDGGDEIAGLAVDFNAMADRLQQYRHSTLGELLEAQRAAQAAIDSLPGPVVVVGLDGQIHHANRAAETILHLAPDTTAAGLEPAVREVVEAMRRHVASGRGAWVPRNLEDAFRLSTPDGDRYFLPHAMPVYAEEGGAVGTTVVLEDVTRVRRLEELRNDLVATVAHEFRTPLTSMRMAVHLLVEGSVGELTPRQADLVYAARADCERLQSIVDELLDLSRIQAGRIALERQRAEPEELVRAAVDAHRGAAAHRGVRLRAEVLPGIGSVDVDVERMQVAFSNILQNAIRYSPEGGEVVIRATAEDGRIRFEFVDSGPGIPDEYREVVFEKYMQLPGTQPGGAGLGLFLAKEIVDSHGGSIGVESGPGRGSTFRITLPEAPRDAPG